MEEALTIFENFDLAHNSDVNSGFGLLINKDACIINTNGNQFVVSNFDGFTSSEGSLQGEEAYIEDFSYVGVIPKGKIYNYKI